MKASDPLFRVRLDPETLEWIRQRAEANCRTMNGEINFHLKAAMAAEGNQPPASTGGAQAAGHSREA